MTLTLESCEVDLDNRTVWRANDRIKLSLKESRLLKYLSSRPDQIVEREALYRDVYQYRKGVQSRTLDVAIIRLRKKIERDPKEPVHLLSVYGSGYMFTIHTSASPKSEPTVSQTACSSNVPPNHRPFFGREEELVALSELMMSSRRCVTVLGPPGVGKTRLIQQWANEQHQRRRIGEVAYCDIRNVENEASFLTVVSNALGVSNAQAESDNEAFGGRITEAMSVRESLVVLVDNAETGLNWSAKWIQRWGHHTENVRFLVTSQVPLGIPIEQRLQVHRLSRTDTMTTSEPSPALALFLDRAQAVKPDFALTDANRDVVLGIIEAVDGLPLAIELAAARLHLMSLSEIQSRLKYRFKLLKNVGSTNGSRQRTLEAAVDSSWELLSPWEQSALAQLSVFQGGFDWEAVEEIVDLSLWPDAPWNLDVVSTLVERSLIEVVERPQRAVRLMMLSTIQAYAEARLAEAPAAVVLGVRLRHVTYFSQFGIRGRIRILKTRKGLQQRRRLQEDVDNIAAALQCAIANGLGPESVACLSVFIFIDGHEKSHIRILDLEDSILGLSLTGQDRARALYHLTSLMRGGQPLKSLQYLDEAYSIAEGLNDVEQLCRIAIVRADMASVLTRTRRQSPLDYGQAIDEVWQLAERTGNASLMAWAYYQRGLYLWVSRRHDEAVLDFREAHKRAILDDNLQAQLSVVQLLAITKMDESDLEAATELFEQQFELARLLGKEYFVAMGQSNLAELFLTFGRPNEGLPYAKASKKVFRKLGLPHQTCRVSITIGGLLKMQGEYSAALELLQAILPQAIHKEWHAQVLAAMGGIGQCYTAMGASDEVHLQNEARLAYGREHAPPVEPNVLFGAAENAYRTGRYQQSQKYIEQALTILQPQIAQEDAPRSIKRQHRVLILLLNVVHAHLGQPCPNDAPVTLDALLDMLNEGNSECPIHRAIFLSWFAEAAALRGDDHTARAGLALVQQEVAPMIPAGNREIIPKVEVVQRYLAINATS